MRCCSRRRTLAAEAEAEEREWERKEKKKKEDTAKRFPLGKEPETLTEWFDATAAKFGQGREARKGHRLVKAKYEELKHLKSIDALPHVIMEFEADIIEMESFFETSIPKTSIESPFFKFSQEKIKKDNTKIKNKFFII